MTQKSLCSQELNVSYNLNMAIYLVLWDFWQWASEELWKTRHSFLFREAITL